MMFQDIKEQRDQDLLVLPTDAAIFEDPSFKVTCLFSVYGW
jgi:L-ascorbate peroxidase